jgi:hypothetical protein
MRDQEEKAEAVWAISLDVECPHCDELLDVLRLDDFQDIIHGIQVGESGADIEFDCYKCDKTIHAKTVY